MQKKIIALAVAALASSAAFAQSNVTIYGIVDMGYKHTDYSGASKSVNSIDSGSLSTSRIGFSGVEDLGNGLKAVFKLEYGLTADSNATIGNARQQYVGLSHAMGTVVAGYLQTAGYDWAASALPTSGSTQLSTLYNIVNRGGVVHAAGRAGNAVAYISPTFSGLTVALNHARLSEVANTTGVSDTYANVLGLNYANGPVTAGLVYNKISAAAANSDVDELGVKAAYDFKVAKVSAAYQKFDSDATTGSDSAWGLGVAVPFGKSSVSAEYSKGKMEESQTVGFQNDRKAWNIAYNYSLSKRTTAYAGYLSVNDDTVANAVAAGDFKKFVAGVRHSF